MDRLTSIEIFVRAVECGSFASVAEEKNLSAQMVGKHVRGLEALLGTKLLYKSTRSQSLTTAGEHYYHRCKNILAELRAAEEDIHRTINEPSGKLNIASSVNFGISILAPIIAKFHNDYPKMNVDICLTNQPIDLSEESYDIIFSDHTQGYESFIAQRIRSYSLIACASPCYLDRYGTPQHPNELVHHQCLENRLGKNSKHWRFTDGEKLYTPEIASRLAINSGQAILNAALEGAGITLQPTSQITDALKNGRLVQILADYPLKKINMYMIYLPHLRNTAKLNALQKYFVEE
ncbi:LysR family transcriptional regulator [Photobacterium alginatilyticum]|uniref:LysR family transcriptional regulator n=1 Tax=Photobacterium alginatilyticum TaxID=1775171 RepID=A0ABW9YBT3_9GAMM|nr:LysR family transcriptional regulator [Photobacterium alginatilyticum]NBI51234.1 LysR family transcriptional regulator [Photobacterium alginatilyticum]